MHTPKQNLSEFDMSGQSDAGVSAAPAAAELPNGQIDREGDMAKADLYKLASYAHKLYEKIQPEDQLEAWVQAKITKAADYMASVYHYLAYEMKFSEYGHHLDNSDTLSESQKAVLKNRLMEAKEKVKDLKKAQAEKVKESQLNELSKDTLKSYAKKASAGASSSAFSAGMAQDDKQFTKHNKKASKREAGLDKAIDKLAKDKEVAESKVQDHHADLVHAAAIVAGLKRRSDMPKEPKVPKVTPPAVNDYDDIEDEGMGMEETPPLAPERQIDPAVKGKLEAYGKKTRAMAAAVKRIAKKDYDGDGKIESEKDEVIGSRRKAAGLDEAAPSAGMTKKEKSAVVKKAKKGEDIGKPGKGFKALAAKATKEYGSKEKGGAVAAAAMWKNAKKKVAEAAKAAKPDFLDMDKDGDKKEPMKKAVAEKGSKKETVKESTDFTRMQEQLGRLNRSETHQLVEASEADKLRALTQRLNG